MDARTHTLARIEEIQSYAGAVTVDVDGVGRIFVCHGSPRGDQELVTPGTPDERIRALLKARNSMSRHGARPPPVQARVLGITSMNAGSVGLQYGGTPAAYWAEIGAEISLNRTPYDLDEAVQTHRAGSRPPIAS